MADSNLMSFRFLLNLMSFLFSSKLTTQSNLKSLFSLKLSQSALRRVSLHRFGDIGHLPLDMVTFH